MANDREVLRAKTRRMVFGYAECGVANVGGPPILVQRALEALKALREWSWKEMERTCGGEDLRAVCSIPEEAMADAESMMGLRPRIAPPAGDGT